jgi:hypothetical protein
MPTRRRRAATRVVQVSRRVSRRASASRFNIQRLVPAPVKRGLTGIGAYDVTQRIAARLGVQGTGSRIAGMALGFSAGGVEGAGAALAVDTMDQGFIASAFAGNGGGGNGNGLNQGGIEAV